MRRDLRLLPLAGAVWAAALLCVFVPAAAVWAVGAGIVAAITALAVWRRRGALVVVILASGAAVALSAALALPGRAEATAWGGRIVEATAEITSSASIGQDGRLWFDARLTGIGSPGSVAHAAAPIRVGVDLGEGFDMGAGIRVTGQAAQTDAGERSAIVVFASAAEVERTASGVFALAAELKGDFVSRSTALPEPGAGLLPGLAVGDTRAVTADLNDDMRASGLSHLTAVSGANCAIVVGAMFGLVALCGGGRRLRVAIAVAALAGFVVLVTPEPSVIRAAVMAGVAMLSVLLGRPSAGAGMLALCAAGILIVDPWLSSTPGFALSVVASGALILLAPPLAHGMERWMPRLVALAVAVPLAAQLACGPIIALFAEQQSLVGVAANMIADPAAPIATVIGLLACLAAPIPPLADLLAASAWLPAAWIATTATVSAELPLAELSLIPGIGSALLVAAVSAAFAVVLIRPGGGEVLITPLRWVRGASAAVLVVVFSLGTSHVLLAGPLATATSPDGWSIAACDVGQGDALVVRSEGEVALVDTGPEPGPLEDCLRALGIDRVDLLVLTHFDLDHVGGVDAVQGRVGQVLHGPPGEEQDEQMLARLVAGGAEPVDAFAGLSGTLGGASWKVLWPQRGSAIFPPGNDSSVVMLFEDGGVPKSLYLGDLSAQAQRMLLRTAHLGSGFAVVKVAHHGSADQDPGLYETLRPSVAVISVGEGNDYGHPREEILAVLDALGAHVLRTDQQGRVLLGMEGGELEVWTDRGG
ncbi:MAG: ComEC/Rec2 family competence protein [Microbacterium sp.]|uniref:ComEC/Rec2 family competence protein n=1 Tax=Microbacterium sp. TaxID=51671 RepID=UPI001D4DBD3E|nr:ComEC/Rec2 family competence protein [Microbacterium sp.]MBW8763210.1 ComEC/Rec2 family competence protein [Microbacterium sp.]